MGATPPRPTVLTLAALVAALFGGAGLGLILASRLAPGSAVVSVLSFLLLPLALFIGFHFWLGLALVLVIVRSLTGVARREAAERVAIRHAHDIPPGEWAFLPVSSSLALAGGVVAGLLSDTTSILFATAAYGVVGTLYGLALWRLARAGYLPFPGSD